VSEGYSYTTLTGRRGEPLRVWVSLYLDGRAQMKAYGTGGGGPHLTVSLDGVSATFGPPDYGAVTAQDAQIARQFADTAAEYAAAVEQLATAGEEDPAAA
jgi:hypothetical protein